MSLWINLPKLGSRRSVFMLITFVAALTASLALYFSLGTRPAAALLQCGYKQDHIRDEAGHHKTQRIPIFRPDCTQVGAFIDSFLGPGDKGNGNSSYITERIQLQNADPDTTYQQFVDVRPVTESKECAPGPAIFEQPGLQITTDKNGKANAQLKVNAPGFTDRNGNPSPIPDFIPGRYLCYVYRFVPINPSGGDVLETPPTVAYIDTPGGPQGGPKFN